MLHSNPLPITPSLFMLFSSIIEEAAVQLPLCPPHAAPSTGTPCCKRNAPAREPPRSYSPHHSCHSNPDLLHGKLRQGQSRCPTLYSPSLQLSPAPLLVVHSILCHTSAPVSLCTVKVLRAMVAGRAHPDFETRRGQTALVEACKSGCMQVSREAEREAWPEDM